MTGQRPNMTLNHSVLLQSPLMQRTYAAGSQLISVLTKLLFCTDNNFFYNTGYNYNYNYKYIVSLKMKSTVYLLYEISHIVHVVSNHILVALDLNCL